MLMPVFSPSTSGGGSSCTAWEIDTATYTREIGAGSFSPNGLFFKSDGTKVFYTISGGGVYHRTLSTAWDISSIGLPTSEDLSAQSTSWMAIHLKSNGTKMYLLGGNVVYQYTLSSAYDVSSSSYDSKSFSVLTQESSATGMFFGDSGTKMYVIGDGNNTVYQYALSSAWDVSTASYSGVSKSVSAQTSFVTGLCFSPNGEKMYVLNSSTTDNCYQYDLSIAWDVSSASYASKTFAVSGGTGNSHQDIFVKTDGLSMYFTEEGSRYLKQYTIC